MNNLIGLHLSPLILPALLLICINCGQDQPLSKEKERRDPVQGVSRTALNNPCVEFDKLNTQVRDGLIDREEARKRIRELIPKIREYFYAKGGADADEKSWLFPVRGYGSNAIGGTNGSGYIAKGYNYFDGNKHGGHPAHDIFIRDRDQDELDDSTGKPVNVISMSAGVVVACAAQWKSGSDLRGGKYIYIYDPVTNALFYYAHNREIFVEPGMVVKPGDLIASVGRSGKNAFPSRSPTHLHIMYLVIEDGYPKPKDIYKALSTK
jgi:peptidoglycan LD-endopeptidase LytH